MKAYLCAVLWVLLNNIVLLCLMDLVLPSFNPTYFFDSVIVDLGLVIGILVIQFVLLRPVLIVETYGYNIGDLFLDHIKTLPLVFVELFYVLFLVTGHHVPLETQVIFGAGIFGVFLIQVYFFRSRFITIEFPE